MRLLPGAGMTRGILPSGLLRERRYGAAPPCLRMDVFGEPAVRQLGTHARGARLGEHVGAGGRELQSGADVVYEEADLAIALPPARALGEDIGEIGKALHA